MKSRLFSTLSLLALGAAAQPVVPLSLERIHADPPLEGQLPVAAQLSPGGRYVSYLQPSSADSEVLELWVRPLPQGEARRLAAVADLVGGQKSELTEAEKMALERRRLFKRGITEYQWCGERDERIIVPLAGDLYLIELDGERARNRRLTFDDAEPERDPRCDPAGTQLAYVKRNDLWLQALAGGAARALTSTGSETLSTGLAEFIAAEELNRYDGYWWSKDGRQLLAIEVDDSKVPLKGRMQIRAEGSQMTQQRYPAAGEPNAQLRPLVIDAATGARRPLPLPAATEYISSAGWFADGTPWLQTLNREQTELRLTEYPDGAAPPRTLLVERDTAWVETHGDLRELEGWLLSGKPSVLWSSERSGRRQLWQLDRVGGALRPLTDAAESVSSVVCASARRIVYAGLQAHGMAQELFEVESGGRVREIDPGSSPRWRSAEADRHCEQLLVQTSAWSEPPVTSLRALNGDTPPLRLAGSAPDPLLARIAPKAQTLEFRAADGVTPLNALYVPPLAASVNPAGHAVIVVVYGGPQVNLVRHAWTRDALLFAHWQRLGFGVLMVENRGMHGKDRDFTRAHYRQFGQVEVADLFAVAIQLPQKLPGADPKRIGLQGWSYGGYLAARAMLDPKTPFAAAVAGAPVTDWTLYDTAYTERFLGLPDGGKAAPYRDSNLVLRAAQLAGPLMLMHGTADDNVLFEHTLRLIAALQTAGKLFETVIYPGQTHGLGGREERLHADRASTDFLVRQLRP